MYSDGLFSFAKRSLSAPSCLSKPPDSIKNWADHFFWVDSRVFPISVPLYTGGVLEKDPAPHLTASSITSCSSFLQQSSFRGIRMLLALWVYSLLSRLVKNTIQLLRGQKNGWCEPLTIGRYRSIEVKKGRAVTLFDSRETLFLFRLRKENVVKRTGIPLASLRQSLPEGSLTLGASSPADIPTHVTVPSRARRLFYPRRAGRVFSQETSRSQTDTFSTRRPSSNSEDANALEKEYWSPREVRRSVIRFPLWLRIDPVLSAGGVGLLKNVCYHRRILTSSLLDFVLHISSPPLMTLKLPVVRPELLIFFLVQPKEKDLPLRPMNMDFPVSYRLLKSKKDAGMDEVLDFPLEAVSVVAKFSAITVFSFVEGLFGPSGGPLQIALFLQFFKVLKKEGLHLQSISGNGITSWGNALLNHVEVTHDRQVPVSFDHLTQCLPQRKFVTFRALLNGTCADFPYAWPAKNNSPGVGTGGPDNHGNSSHALDSSIDALCPSCRPIFFHMGGKDIAASGEKLWVILGGLDTLSPSWIISKVQVFILSPFPALIISSICFSSAAMPRGCAVSRNPNEIRITCSYVSFFPQELQLGGGYSCINSEILMHGVLRSSFYVHDFCLISFHEVFHRFSISLLDVMYLHRILDMLCLLKCKLFLRTAVLDLHAASERAIDSFVLVSTKLRHFP
ncbi:hypothetical protein Tco_0431213 [Tanacetum coccineum]